MNNRVEWVDAARGIGIILVVFGHVWRGLNEAGLIESAGAFSAVDAAIYLFHMPLFFLVSGLLFEKSVRRDGVWTSLLRRAVTLFYPLLLWSWITAAFLIVAGSLTNRSPISPLEALLYPFPPKDIFWFLWALFVIQTIASLLARAPTIAIVSLFSLSFVVLLAFGMEPFPYLLKRVVDNLPFFAIGVLLARWGQFPIGVGRWTGPIGAIAFLSCILWAALNSDLINSWPAYVVSLLATLSFCASVAWLCALTPRHYVAPISFLGVASIAIYVSHIILASGTRIVLVKLGIEDLALHLLAGTVAGIVPPALLYFLVVGTPIQRLLGFGWDYRKVIDLSWWPLKSTTSSFHRS